MRTTRITGWLLLSVLTCHGTAFAQPDSPPVKSATTAAFEAEVEKYERADQAQIETDAADPLESFGAALVQMIIVLGFVCLLAYFLLGKVLPRLMKVQQPTAPQRMLEVVDRLALDQRRSIMVIKLGERFFLIGATDSGINLLSRLETEEIEDALAAAQARRGSTSLGRLAGGLLGRSRGES